MEYEAFDEIEHFVLNEAKLTLPRLLKDFMQGKAERIYTTAEFADLTTSPLPLWEILDMDRYATMCVQFTRDRTNTQWVVKQAYPNQALQVG